MVTLDPRATLPSIVRPRLHARPLQQTVQDSLPLECVVAEALRGSSYAGLSCVTCDIREGAAFLHGIVRSYYLKQLAQEIVRKIDGIEAVVNRLDVLSTEQ